MEKYVVLFWGKKAQKWTMSKGRKCSDKDKIVKMALFNILAIDFENF